LSRPKGAAGGTLRLWVNTIRSTEEEEEDVEERKTRKGAVARFWVLGVVGALVLIIAAVAGVFAANLATDDDSANADTDDRSVDAGAESGELAEARAGGEKPDFYGVRINPPWPKPDFVLTDTGGNDFDIVAETEGYVTLIALGYTNCPDICPTHMLDIREMLRAMDPEDARQVKVIFITTDPARDTPEVLDRWLGLFNPDFIGLTADQETIERVQIAMGVEPAEAVETERARAGGFEYEVTHAAFVYAFDPETELAHLVYPFGIEREHWLHDVTKLVQEGYTGN
jgi:protein SCO1